MHRNEKGPPGRPFAGAFGAVQIDSSIQPLSAAFGAARLAICAVTGASPETVMTRPAVAETILPDAALAEAYGAAHAAYVASYIPMKALP